MASRYWIVGGDYADCDFDRIVPGSEQVHGPFGSERRAQTEWKRLTFRDRNPASRRYSIAAEYGR
ncbi:hypothetical protein ABDK56_08735 [Sphingomonas sp. ASV193]|uniref:DUF4170 domain-containing protein n=1 Tax=Sphingomonas sp. ASV193 TaxID=3144405 RepID=UPI0032E87BAE